MRAAEASNRLADRYGHLGEVVRRAGRTWPVALLGGPAACRAVGEVHDAPVDGALRRGGEEHLRRALAAAPGSYDGAALVQATIAPEGMTLARAGYFAMLATCDALRAEAEEDPEGDWPLRARAEAVAGPDPLRAGMGRAAAVGVTGLLLARTDDGGRGAVVGRRAATLPLDPGRWHLVPSGTLEPTHGAPGEDRLRATVVRELDEEAPGAAPVRVESLGLGVDLLRLRPEACFRLRSDARAADLAAAAGDGEYDDLEVVAEAALPELWQRELTPAAAIALALAERAGPLPPVP